MVRTWKIDYESIDAGTYEMRFSTAASTDFPFSDLRKTARFGAWPVLAGAAEDMAQKCCASSCCSLCGCSSCAH